MIACVRARASVCMRVGECVRSYYGLVCLFFFFFVKTCTLCDIFKFLHVCV